MNKIANTIDEIRAVADLKSIPKSVVGGAVRQWKTNPTALKYIIKLAKNTPDSFWPLAIERCVQTYRLKELHDILFIRGRDGLSQSDSSEKKDQDKRIINTIEKLQRLLAEKPVNEGADLALPLLLGYSDNPKYADHRRALTSDIDNLIFHMGGPTPDHLLECLKGAIANDGKPKSTTYAPDTRKLPRQTGGPDRIAMQYFMEELIQWFSDDGGNSPESLIIETVGALLLCFDSLPDCDLSNVYRAAKLRVDKQPKLK